MPALPAVAKVIAVAFATTNGDDGYVNINRLHFEYTGTPPTSSELVSFITTAVTAFGSALNPNQGTDKTVSGAVADDLSSPTSATAEVTVALNGALTGAVVPDDVAFVMSAKVARRYRGGHPRTYLCVGDVTKLSDGKSWTSGFVTAMETAWAGFITAVEGAGWAGAGTITPVNVSYYHDALPVTYPSGRVRMIPQLRVGGPLVDPVVTYVGRKKLGSQRRRLGA